MTRRAARAAAAGFLAVAGFQVAVVAGAPWGEYTQGGQTPGALPTSGRVVAGFSCALLLVMAGSVLARGGSGPLRGVRPRLVTPLAWFTQGYAVIAVVANLITRSSAERNVFAPTAAVLLLLVTTVMVTTRRAR